MREQRTRFQDAARLALQHHGTATGLAAVLYDRWYAPADGLHASPLRPPELIAHLRAADAASARFEPGWTVLAPEQAVTRIGPPASAWQVAAARGDEARWIDPIDLLPAEGLGLRPQAGAAVSVVALRDSTGVLPGWWTSTGEAWPSARPPLVRLYWAAEPKHLFRVVRAITSALDPVTPYALKCPLDMDRCRRPDAVVLFLPAADWAAVSPQVADAHHRARDWLRRGVPALTQELATGLGLAEDPGQDSFGSSRCRMVASSLWQAHHAGSRDLDDLCAAAATGLEQHGVSVTTPWLNPGSTATYPLVSTGIRIDAGPGSR